MDKKLRKRIGLIWRSDWRAPDAATKYEARLRPVADALRAAGFQPEPMAFLEERAEAFRARLGACAGALIWVNPFAEARDRSLLDRLLREAAANGVWVSAHPDVIAWMATKQVLVSTQQLGWGSDAKCYERAEAFAAQFLAGLAGGARVLKPLTGNDGRGVVKVSGGPSLFSLQETSGEVRANLSWAALNARVAEMLAASPAIIDQECHDAAAGMVRCYMSFDRVIGFAEQAPKSRQDAFAMNPAKAMHGSDHPRFGELRDCMDKDWTPGLKRLLGLETPRLPALWDADFLHRRQRSDRGSRYALCEINASCVSPFPDNAPIDIANGLKTWLGD
jgi:hypothetical protein